MISLKTAKHILCLSLLISQAGNAVGSSPDITTIPQDLTTPKVVQAEPAPGKRVFQTLPEYEKSTVRHSLYLPTDWIKGKTYPVIVEFNGNGSTVASGKASLGYGISDGKRYIWVTLPFVSKDGQTDMQWWWGDPDRTADYAKTAVESICSKWGGNPKAVILTGYSRGAIACNYIGLRNDNISKLWLGMVPVSHYDNLKWGQTDTEHTLRVKRLLRLGNTPQYICGEMVSESHSGKALLKLIQERGYTDIHTAHRELKLKSILDQEQIRKFINQNHPHAKVTFDAFPWVNHDVDWILRDTPNRKQLRKWVSALVDGNQN